MIECTRCTKFIDSLILLNQAIVHPIDCILLLLIIRALSVLKNEQETQ